MKYLILLVATLFSVNAIAQNAPTQTPGYAIIKGHIKNHTRDMWDYSEDTYLDFVTSSLPVDKDGNFFKRLQIDGQYRSIYFPDGDGLVINLQKGDTITVEFDQQNINNTIAIHSPRPDRDKEIQTFAAVRKARDVSNGPMGEIFSNKSLTDTAKFTRLNHLYNQEIELLFAGGARDNYINTAVDVYFYYARYSLMLRLLPIHNLYIEHPTDITKNIQVLSATTPYMVENSDWFRNSAEYRDFIFDYVRFHSAFNTLVNTAKDERHIDHNYADLYNGLASFHFTETRDWFITKTLIFNFQYSPFAEATAAYNEFAGKVQTPKYADTLKQFFSNIQRLKPGIPAPGFTLKDDNGKQVSLAQLKGKVVYIDFWGVGCGPCISDIKTDVPALHEKYKGKNIMFVNVCVDSDEPTWKENLKKLNLDGLNLIAEGWTKNPICQAYNVNSIPHYFLIGADGKIVDNNSPRPGDEQILYNKLDNLLK